jgi:hypothetical protein
MSSQPATGFGRIVFTPLRVPRLQLGGRRPPNGRSPGALRRRLLRFSLPRSRHLRAALHLFEVAALGAVGTAVLLGSSALAAQQTSPSFPNLSGTYRCEGAEKICALTGTTFTVTQSADNFEIKNERGETGNGKLTSNISLTAGPIWNMVGVLAPDNRAIQWSNGTVWRKQ